MEESFNKEERILIPSPRVETYDKKPEMAAFELTAELEKRIDSEKYEFILTNFANPDMVGHTGNLKATIKAIEIVDQCLGKIFEKCIKKNYILIITSDHGNADLMFNRVNRSSVQLILSIRFRLLFVEIISLTKKMEHWLI